MLGNGPIFLGNQHFCKPCQLHIMAMSGVIRVALPNKVKSVDISIKHEICSQSTSMIKRLYVHMFDIVDTS